MKKSLSVITCAALTLSLSACGGGGGDPSAAFDPSADAQTLLETSGVFGETLEAIDQATACALYGIDEATVTSSAVYVSPGTTAEELAIFAFSSSEDAETATTALGYRVEDRKEELEDYLPDELPKLDKAVVETRGASVLLVIAADYGPVESFLEVRS